MNTLAKLPVDPVASASSVDESVINVLKKQLLALLPPINDRKLYAGVVNWHPAYSKLHFRSASHGEAMLGLALVTRYIVLLTHLTHSLAYSLTHSLAYSLTHTLAYSLTGLLTHWPTHSLTYLLTHLTHLLAYLLTLTHALNHSPTHSLTYSLTYSLTSYLLTYSLNQW